MSKPGKDYIWLGCWALILDEQKQILLMQRANWSGNESWYWSQPGGKVDFGEKVETAIIREIKEELNIQIQLLKFLCYTDHIISDENQHWVAISYLAKIIDGTPKIMEPSKCQDLQWFDINQVPALLTAPTIDALGVYQKLLSD